VHLIKWAAGLALLLLAAMTLVAGIWGLAKVMNGPADSAMNMGALILIVTLLGVFGLAACAMLFRRPATEIHSTPTQRPDREPKRSVSQTSIGARRRPRPQAN
jgi:hypothetical protein